jgi:hypothetical protein
MGQSKWFTAKKKKERKEKIELQRHTHLLNTKKIIALKITILNKHPCSYERVLNPSQQWRQLILGIKG